METSKIIELCLIYNFIDMLLNTVFLIDIYEIKLMIYTINIENLQFHARILRFFNHILQLIFGNCHFINLSMK